MSNDKAIYGFFKASSTVKPTIMGIDYFDGGSVVESPVQTTSLFQARIRFSKEMDPTVEPTIRMESSSGINPTVPGGGTWENLVVSGDAYRTPNINLTADHVGVITVIASGAQSVDNNIMALNGAVDQFTLDGATGPSDLAVVISEGVEAINRPNVSLRWSAAGASQIWISGDVQPADNTGQWIPSNVSGDNVNIGSGDVVLDIDGDGLKTVYAKFQTPSGDESAFVSDSIILDRSGDAITDVACAVASGGSAIGNASFTTDKEPYFAWSQPSGAAAIRGYAYVLTSGDGTEAELPTNINSYDNFVDYAGNPVQAGIHKFIVRAQDEAKNWGSGDVFDYYLASGDLFFMPGRIRAYTADDKVTELQDGVVTTSGDSAVYAEWIDPQSPGDDTFYINTSGDDVNEKNFEFQTPNPNYQFGVLGEGMTRIMVRPITGLGASGDRQEFSLCWVSGDLV